MPPVTKSLSHFRASLVAGEVYTIDRPKDSGQVHLKVDSKKAKFYIENPYPRRKDPSGLTFKVITPGWPKPDSLVVELLSPEDETLFPNRLCVRGLCANNACIDSVYCLDHQVSEVEEPGEWKKTIKLHSARLMVVGIYTIQKWDNKDRNLVSLDDGHFVENPFTDKALHKGRTFKVLTTNLVKDEATIEVLPDEAAPTCQMAGCSRSTAEMTRIDGKVEHFSFCDECREAMHKANPTTLSPKSERISFEELMGLPKAGEYTIKPGETFAYDCETTSGHTCMAEGCSNPTLPMPGVTIPYDSRSRPIYFSCCSSCQEKYVAKVLVNSSSKESAMNGIVYTSAVVVRNETVQAGEGVTTGVTRSRVVYTHSKAIVTAGPDQARALVLAAAVVASKGEIDLEDTTVTYEVKLTAAA